MNTYSSFVIGYILFWAVPFVVLFTLMVKLNRLENLVKSSEQKDR